MKKSFLLIALFFLLSALLILSGCAKKQVLVTSNPTSSVATAEKAEPTAESAKAAVLSEIDLFESEQIFFAFDSYDLKSESREILARKAEWLKANPEISIKIEGHCDERGTAEYNLALGQRRAEAAMSYLTTLGISNARIATVSYGEMNPSYAGHDEMSWAKNRRSEFKVVR